MRAQRGGEWADLVSLAWWPEVTVGSDDKSYGRKRSTRWGRREDSQVSLFLVTEFGSGDMGHEFKMRNRHSGCGKDGYGHLFRGEAECSENTN